MTPADITFATLLAQLFRENWHYGLIVLVSLLLMIAVRSKRGISIQLGGQGNGSPVKQGQGGHIATNGYVSNKRFEDHQASIARQLSDHDEDTKQLRHELGLIREAVQGQGRVLARIEGKLDER